MCLKHVHHSNYLSPLILIYHKSILKSEVSILYKNIDLLASRIFGESVGYHCWHHFKLAKNWSCYVYI